MEQADMIQPFPSMFMGSSGGSSYHANAVHLDGSTALYRASELVGIANSSNLTISYWVNTLIDGITIFGAQPISFSEQINGDGFPDHDWIGTGTNLLSVGNGVPETFAYDEAFENYVFFDGPSGIGDNSWHHVLWSIQTNFDAGSRIGQLAVDGTLVSVTEPDDEGVAFQAFLECPGITVGADGWAATTLRSALIGDLCDLYFNSAAAIDLTVPSNIAKFISGGKPVFLGDSGELPTGSAPIVFCSGTATTFADNLGTGGGFTIFGSLTNASTSPSD